MERAEMVDIVNDSITEQKDKEKKGGQVSYMVGLDEQSYQNLCRGMDNELQEIFMEDLKVGEIESNTILYVKTIA